MTGLKRIPNESIDLVVTSPPYYGQRDYAAIRSIWPKYPKYPKECKHNWKLAVPRNKRYGENCGRCKAWKGQLGLEPSFELYIVHILQVVQELKRVLKKTGSFYLNIGDSYSGGRGSTSKYDRGPASVISTDPEDEFPEDPITVSQSVPAQSLCDIPHDISIQMVRKYRWIKRNTIIWKKPNNMPGSWKSRLTNTWEFFFHFVKNSKAVLWRNAITGEWTSDKPSKQQYIVHKEERSPNTGEVKDDYFWWCKFPECKITGKSFKSRIDHKRQFENKGEKHKTRGRKPIWNAFGNYYELDRIRVPHKTSTIKRIQQYIERGEKIDLDKHKFDPDRDSQFPMAVLDRISDSYRGKFSTMASGESEGYGSPRARNQRFLKQDTVPGKNAPLSKGFNQRYLEAFMDENLEAGIGATGNRHRLRPEKSAGYATRGKNPGDTIDEEEGKDPRDLIEFYQDQGSGGHEGLWQGKNRYHELGKSPGDDWVLPENNYWVIPTAQNTQSACSSCLFVGTVKDFPGRKCPKCGGKAAGHFAVFPEMLCVRPILSSCPPDGVVLDPFCGSGTTMVTAEKLGRKWIGIELARPFITMAYQNLYNEKLWWKKVPNLWEPPLPTLENYPRKK